VTKLYLLLDSVTRLLSDRINVAAPYPAPTRFSPSSPPPEGTFLYHRETRNVVPTAFYQPTCSPGFSISFFSPSYCRFVDRATIGWKVYRVILSPLTLATLKIRSPRRGPKRKSLRERIDKISIIFPIKQTVIITSIHTRIRIKHNEDKDTKRLLFQ